jgi:hypothetical protein
LSADATPAPQTPKATGPLPPSPNGDCQHRITENDEAGRVWCRDKCGIEIPEEPVLVGDRLIPPVEWLRRAALEYRKLDAKQKEKLLEVKEIQAKKDRIISIAGDLQNRKCHRPGCSLKPHLRSKWCEKHGALHEREMACNRQRRKRGRDHLSRLPRPVTPATPILLRNSECLQQNSK